MCILGHFLEMIATINGWSFSLDRTNAEVCATHNTVVTATMGGKNEGR